MLLSILFSFSFALSNPQAKNLLELFLSKFVGLLRAYAAVVWYFVGLVCVMDASGTSPLLEQCDLVAEQIVMADKTDTQELGKQVSLLTSGFQKLVDSSTVTNVGDASFATM